MTSSINLQRGRHRRTQTGVHMCLLGRLTSVERKAVCLSLCMYPSKTCGCIELELPFLDIPCLVSWNPCARSLLRGNRGNRGSHLAGYDTAFHNAPQRSDAWSTRHKMIDSFYLSHSEQGVTKPKEVYPAYICTSFFLLKIQWFEHGTSADDDCSSGE